MSKESEAAFNKTSADLPAHLSYTTLERQMFLNGYDLARLDAKKQELKELNPVTLPERTDSRYQG